MVEFISREETIKRIKEVYCIGCNSYNGVRCSACGTGDAIDMIEDAPAADVAPVVHGRWISFLGGDHIMPERYYRCSRCGRVESRRQPYCHCGAKMDGGADHEAD